MADKPIGELVKAEKVFPSDLWLCEQAGTAKAVTGQTMISMLTSIADGHGGIQSIEKVRTDNLVDFYRITLADTTTFDFTVSNGKGISKIAKTSTSGLVDTYTITYNDGTKTSYTVTNGAKGDKGDNTYTWIKYASVDPSRPPHSMGDIPDNWIGIYAGAKSSPPYLWSDYKWFKIKGDKGDTGAPATLLSTTTEYQVGKSGTVAPSGEWLKEVPSTPQGRWLWTRTTYRFNSGDPVVTYGVSYVGKDGSGSVNSVDGVTAGPDGNVKLGAWRSINDVTPGEDGSGRLTAANVGAATSADILSAHPDFAKVVPLFEAKDEGVKEGEVIAPGSGYVFASAGQDGVGSNLQAKLEINGTRVAFYIIYNAGAWGQISTGLVKVSEGDIINYLLQSTSAKRVTFFPEVI